MDLSPLLLKNLISKIQGMKSPLDSPEGDKKGLGLEMVGIKALGDKPHPGEDDDHSLLAALGGDRKDDDQDSGGHLMLPSADEDCGEAGGEDEDDMYDLIKRLKG